ncbi:MAG TPA: L,D-transpeptidase, partial [Aggregatilineales bacterium]|nr:L,D-transpeptidase [Aggregatilineales bacterium]
MPHLNPISRREFLRRSSLLAGGGTLLPLSRFMASPAESSEPLVEDGKPMILAGRTLRATAIYAQPSDDARAIGQLTTDSVIEIVTHSLSAAWYGLPLGFVPRGAVQPILPYARPEIRDEIGNGFWAEIVAPVSAIREWCYAHAPVVTRLGFGAVVYVTDRLLTDDGQSWYGLSRAPGSPLLGWVSALHVAEWTPPAPSHPRPAHPNILISLSQQNLSVLDGGKVLVTFPVYASGMSRIETKPGYLHVVVPGTARSHDLPLGVPWLMATDGGQQVHGAFWHNEFGLIPGEDEKRLNGSASVIELTTFESRWLYGWLLCVGEPVETRI